jgi:uncharacterized damage-inducible protein DinB
MLEAWLDYHRATLARKCEGLSPEELRQRSATPSSLSLLGLIRHMADVERGWFRRGVAGEDVGPIHYSPSDPDGDFDNVDDADPDEAFHTWMAECERARVIVSEIPTLDFTFTSKDDPRETFSLRWTLVHMIEEYARHNGHADFLRERIDGVVGQ